MTAVIEISNDRNLHSINIKPEVCSSNEKGVTIFISEEEFKSIQNLNWEGE